MNIICGNGGLLEYVTEEIKKQDPETGVKAVTSAEEAAANATGSCDRIFLAVSWREAEQWLILLSEKSSRPLYRIPAYIKQYGISLPKEEWGRYEIGNIRTTLQYLETHVADTCNLRCRGCMHFSNIAQNNNFPDLGQFEKDFQRLSELFSNILIIRLMGGEPLLNPRLPEYLRIVRTCFPTAELRIVSNGLLIPKQKRELWDTVRDCRAAVDVSPYPPTIGMIGEIRNILDEEGIPYGKIAGELTGFRKSLALSGKSDPQKAMRLCCSAHCRFLRDGKLAKCPLPLLIREFNAVYGQTLPEDEAYDIYGEASGEELKKLLERPTKLCSYCPEQESYLPWERTPQNARMDDWVART